MSRDIKMALESYLGEISIVAFDFAPQDWLSCNGQLLSINRYQALYSLLGTRYGGDGVSTFALPNLNGRMPIGAGTEFVLGKIGGYKNIVLNKNQLPSHTHELTSQKISANVALKMKASQKNADISDPSDAYIALVSDGSGGISNMFTKDETQLVDMKSINTVIDANLTAGNTGATGNSNGIDILNPYLALNFIICVSGIYPNRP